MLRTKFKYENKQRAITQKLSNQELWFMCTALPLDKIYPPTKFHNHSFYSLGDMLQTKFKYEKKKQRAITQRLSKQELRLMCTALPLEIYPPTKFHNDSNYSLGHMHRTEVKFESKQRAITEKKKKGNKSYGSCALHSPLMRSIHPQNFITIVSTVLEICSGQNSSMKINKGQ